ncbi:MAG: hypothetical protein DHS20C19_09930 [Acidimicrobiales bacterium]|nr:MAG: hypothetical protein DHS20C19_09930 [Acidimicrobiales bacterium]
MSGEIEINGHTFTLDTHQGRRGSGEAITLKKPMWMLDRYRELATEFPAPNMVEVGLWDGGSTAFLAATFQPRALVGIELDERPLEALDRFLADSPLQPRVHAYTGVDQADTERLTQLVDTHVEGELDVVIDDASHLLEPTTATFDCLFPRLRAGGVFVIEDWSHDHQMAFGIRRALARGELDPDQVVTGDGRIPDSPQSRIILDCVLATANNDGVIADVRVRQGLAEVRRGDGPVPDDFSIRDHIGEMGRLVSPRPANPD